MGGLTPLVWFDKVTQDMSMLANAVTYYNKEYLLATKDTKIIGSLERNAQELGGITTQRYTQLQDIESILKYLNIKYDKMRSDFYKTYTEHYNRDLSDRAIEKYIDGESTIIDMNVLITQVALVRNSYLGILKGLEIKNWQISNIVKLRTLGLENAQLD